jgi:hypothetical protein
VFVELGLHSDDEISVTLSYDGSLDLAEIRALQVADHSLRAIGNSIELKHSGDGTYEIALSDDTESRLPLTMRVTSGKTLLFEGTLPPRRE